MEKEKEKWYQSKALFITISIATSAVLFVQNHSISNNQTRIEHRLDVRDAYFNKGLIDGAKEREKGYFEMRTWGERMLNHCRTEKNGCNLPNDLTVIPNERKFDSLEAILTKNKE